MKKRFSYLFTIILSVSLLTTFVVTGCNAKKIDLSDKVNIVCTIFPEYDWVQQILGNSTKNTTLSLIVKNGVDLHSFQPSAADIVQISTCDLFIFVGGESDKWVKEALSSATNKNMKILNLMDLLGENLKEEEIIEGMESEEENNDDETDDEKYSEIEYDEHIWLSLQNAQTAVKAITDSLISLDPENAAVYSDNSKTYLQKLSQLNQTYAAQIKSSKKQTVIFCDRFPFRYLTDDYNLRYYAAFPGCSAETEASFETVAFLSKKIDELGINNVCIIDGSNNKLAKTIIQNSSNQKCNIITLDSMQSTTLKEAFNGKTYINTMENNLKELVKALE